MITIINDSLFEIIFESNRRKESEFFLLHSSLNLIDVKNLNFFYYIQV